MVILPRDGRFARNLSTIQEIQAREGPGYAVTHPGESPIAVAGRITVPKSATALDPILLTVALRPIAYHVAVLKGRDIDRPRNLARAVTVE